METNNYMFDKLAQHIGHAIEIVGYCKAKDDSHLFPVDEELDWENVSVECLDCNEVLIDYDKYD